MEVMFDYHMHTIISDGDLIPAELIRRGEIAGYRILGISDHSDLATIASQLPVIAGAAKAENVNGRVRVLAGTEITHVRPGQILEAVRMAREVGAQYVMVHGETLSEPVAPGTNRAAIEAGVDILAHPGLIDPDDVRLASERGVFLEISGRRGHSLANGHVAKLAHKYGAKLIFGSDTHTVGDVPTRSFAHRICRAAGLDETAALEMFANAEAFGIAMTPL
ncbi:MAG: histidinol phosphate phosphatase domain-containing protein [Planctomycetota bacterium]|jgi:histidinol phosphatase-like PHP family hydrolase|nr:histidinol phosphate phosphatase domain-containing protein [Planctomycetota bacterium]